MAAITLVAIHLIAGLAVFTIGHQNVASKFNDLVDQGTVTKRSIKVRLHSIFFVKFSVFNAFIVELKPGIPRQRRIGRLNDVEEKKRHSADVQCKIKEYIYF